MTTDERITAINNKERFDTADLVEIMDILRERCPWDREQTHESVRQGMLEEAYEVCDAIDRSDAENLCEELGDVLLQVVFHAKMSDEEGDFDYGDVVGGICRKLIVRHPHVFGDTEAATTGQVLVNWDRIKAQTKGQSAAQTIEDVPRALPALMRAQKLAKRAAKAGLHELPDELSSADTEAAKEELGKRLFALCGAAQRLDISAEEALSEENERFLSKFR